MRPEETLRQLWEGTDFLHDDRYWRDVRRIYGEGRYRIPIPITNSHSVLRYFQTMFKCARCGRCCRYKAIPINVWDRKRLDQAGIDYEVIIRDGAQWIEAGDQGCPFLQDNQCTIYDHRPDACFTYPTQNSPREGDERLWLAVLCQPAIDALRTLIDIILKDNPGATVTPWLEIKGG